MKHPMSQTRILLLHAPCMCIGLTLSKCWSQSTVFIHSSEWCDGGPDLARLCFKDFLHTVEFKHASFLKLLFWRQNSVHFFSFLFFFSLVLSKINKKPPIKQEKTQTLIIVAMVFVVICYGFSQILLLFWDFLINFFFF